MVKKKYFKVQNEHKVKSSFGKEKITTTTKNFVNEVNEMNIH